jgi:hypothetical protein
MSMGENEKDKVVCAAIIRWVCGFGVLDGGCMEPREREEEDRSK